MIYHVFNSSLISGPETLVFPALAQVKDRAQVILLRESRVSDEKQKHVESYLQSQGLTYQVIPVHSRYDRTAIEKLAEVLRGAADLEVAHAHDVKPSFYLLKAAQQVKDRKFAIVSTHHGVNARSGLINKIYEKIYVRFVLPKFDRALVVCSPDKGLLVNRGLADHMVDIHLNGVTRNKVSAAERAEKQKQVRQQWGLNLQPGTFVFGVAARLESEKRHSFIIDVVQKITQLDPEYKFVVVCFGRGALQEQLAAKTKALGLEDKILWKGYRSGLGEEFVGFDALLSLSLAEGLPINLIEAGWAATPIFASRVDGVSDLVSSENLGALVSVNENAEEVARKMLQFASSNAVLEKKGMEFQQHVERNFSQGMWLKRLFEIYAQLKMELN